MTEELTTSPVIGMTGVDPSGSLLKILQQIQTMQSAPLISPDNPWQQFAAAIGGLGAGMQGRPNPVLEQAMAQRKMGMQGLQQQAGIAGTMATIQHQKTQEETAKQARLDATRRLALDTYKALKDDDDPDVRTQAIMSGQEAGVIPKSIDPRKAAMAVGFEKGHDQLLTLIGRGVRPTQDPRFINMYPASVYAGLEDEAMKALATGGPMALNQLRIKKDQPETIAQIEYERLSRIPKAALTPEDRERIGVYRDIAGMHPNGQTELERLVNGLKQDDARNGLPLKPDLDYVRKVKEAMHVGESSIAYAVKYVQEELRKKPTDPGYYGHVLDAIGRISNARATGQYDARLDAPMTAKDMANLRHPDNMQKPPPGWSQRQALMAGYHYVDDKDLDKVADLEKVNSLVGNLFSMADRVVTAKDPRSASMQWARLSVAGAIRANPIAAAYMDERKAFLGNLARALSGERGVLTDGDLNRVDGSMISFRDTISVKDIKKTLIGVVIDTATQAQRDKMFGRETIESKARFRKRMDDLLDKLETTDKIIPKGDIDADQRAMDKFMPEAQK